jgi:ribosomal protein L29
MPKHTTYRDSSQLEITQALTAARKELADSRLGIRTQKIKTHATIRKSRKTIARMLTVLRAQELSGAGATAAPKEKTDGK